jgi:hypothetical protein
MILAILLFLYCNAIALNILVATDIPHQFFDVVSYCYAKLLKYSEAFG